MNAPTAEPIARESAGTSCVRLPLPLPLLPPLQVSAWSQMLIFTTALMHPTINFTLDSFSPTLFRKPLRRTFDWNVRIRESSWPVLRARDAEDEGVPPGCLAMRPAGGEQCARFVGKLYHALKF